jgi:hypothetical protein
MTGLILCFSLSLPAKSQESAVNEPAEKCFSHHECDPPYPSNVPDECMPRITEFHDADCVVSFTIGEDGKPKDISVDCTDSRLATSAECMVASLEYPTHDNCGNVCRMIGRQVDYPIEYRSE